jgi:hypothetical protein
MYTYSTHGVVQVAVSPLFCSTYYPFARQMPPSHAHSLPDLQDPNPNPNPDPNPDPDPNPNPNPNPKPNPNPDPTPPALQGTLMAYPDPNPNANPNPKPLWGTLMAYTLTLPLTLSPPLGHPNGLP